MTVLGSAKQLATISNDLSSRSNNSQSICGCLNNLETPREIERNVGKNNCEIAAATLPIVLDAWLNNQHDMCGDGRKKEFGRNYKFNRFEHASLPSTTPPINK